MPRRAPRSAPRQPRRYRRWPLSETCADSRRLRGRYRRPRDRSFLTSGSKIAPARTNAKCGAARPRGASHYTHADQRQSRLPTRIFRLMSTRPLLRFLTFISISAVVGLAAAFIAVMVRPELIARRTPTPPAEAAQPAPAAPP